jgi:monoamine oxidase
LRIGIVGMGFAGMRTAMLLERAGIDVEMFEARGRPGGRMHCVDEGEGVLYEAGGEWIDADHLRVLGLLAEFGCEADVRGHWPQKLIYRNHVTTEHLVWSEALEDDLRVEGIARELCQGLRPIPWENTNLEELDQRTLADFLRENTNSERGHWWVTSKLRSDEGDDLERIGLLGWLTGYMHYLERDGDVMSAYRLPGGSRVLAEKIIAKLRGAINFGSVLERVTQNGDGVLLQFDNGISQVDKVVLTLPPGCLEHVVFEPALTVDKRCAIEAGEMGRACKIVWQFDEAWWKNLDWGGSMLCDGPLQQTWDSSLSEAPLLTAYICGEESVKWGQLGDPVKAGLYELCQLFPAAKNHFQRGWFHEWNRDPYSLGAFSHLAPGYVLEHLKHISPHAGRVFFAGEHTSSWIGFLEGALESAERVVREIAESYSK